MGLFLQTALFPGCDESIARDAVEAVAKIPAFQGRTEAAAPAHLDFCLRTGTFCLVLRAVFGWYW